MSYLVYLLPALGCPLAVGLVMWLLTGGSGRRPSPPPTDAEIATLRAEIARARAQPADDQARRPLRPPTRT